MDSTDVPKHTTSAPLLLIFITFVGFLFFVLTLTSRLFDAEYYFLVYIYVSSV